MPQALLLVQQLLTLLVQYGPELANDVELAMGLLRQGTDPTPEQAAEVAAAMKRAHDHLQAVIAAKTKTTGA